MTRRITLTLGMALMALMAFILPASASVAHGTPSTQGTVQIGRCTAHYDWKVGQDYYIGGVKQWGQADWETNCSPPISMQTRVHCTTAYGTHSTAYSGHVKGLEINDRASCGLNDTRDNLQIQFDRTGPWHTLWSR